jgi:hypothetical protein
MAGHTAERNGTPPSGLTGPDRRLRTRGARAGGLIAATLIILAATGCSADEQEPQIPASPTTEGPQPSSVPTGEPTSTESSAADSAPASSAPQDDQPAGADNAALLTAGETALGELPDAFVVSIDSERRDTVWEVDVVTTQGDERSMIISGDGKTVESGPTGDTDDAEDRAENLRKTEAGTDYRQAAAAIEDARPGPIVELTLDDDDPGLVWEADVRVDGTKYDVHVDADSGEITSNREDRDG